MIQTILLASARAFERAAIRAIIRETNKSWAIVELRAVAETAEAMARRWDAIIVIDEALIEEGGAKLQALADRFGIRCIRFGSGHEATDLGRLANQLPALLTAARSVFAKPPAYASLPNKPESRPKMGLIKPLAISAVDLFIVASSTGGPTALIQLLCALPIGPAPWLIAQHMPPHATIGLAEHIAQKTGRGVREAWHVSPILERSVNILRGGEDFRCFERNGNGIMLRRAQADDSPFHPNADLLMRSVAELDLRCAVIVLSGMGRDGAIGAAVLAERGAAIFVQEPSTCVVPGMPSATLELCPRAVLIDPAHPPQSLIRLCEPTR